MLDIHLKKMNNLYTFFQYNFKLRNDYTQIQIKSNIIDCKITKVVKQKKFEWTLTFILI